MREICWFTKLNWIFKLSIISHASFISNFDGFYFRNCLVGKRQEIKISDLGSYRQIYSSDYCQIAGSLLPLRWMAWESVISVSVHQYSETLNKYNSYLKIEGLECFALLLIDEFTLSCSLNCKMFLLLNFIFINLNVRNHYSSGSFLK